MNEKVRDMLSKIEATQVAIHPQTTNGANFGRSHHIRRRLESIIELSDNRLYNYVPGGSMYDQVWLDNFSNRPNPQIRRVYVPGE